MCQGGYHIVGAPDEAYFPFLSHIVCSLEAVVNTALDATWSGVRPHLRHGSLRNHAIEKKELSICPWVDEAREKRAVALSGDSGNLFPSYFDRIPSSVTIEKVRPKRFMSKL